MKQLMISHETARKIDSQLPADIVQAMHNHGWNALGVYQLVKNELKTETSEQADDLITTAEAGEILGLSHWAVAERCRHGELHCQVIGNRYLVSRDEVLRLAGYVKLAIAAPLMGMTYKRLHRLVKAGKIEGKKINNRWHVKKPAEGQAA